MVRLISFRANALNSRGMVGGREPRAVRALDLAAEQERDGGCSEPPSLSASSGSSPGAGSIDSRRAPPTVKVPVLSLNALRPSRPALSRLPG